MDRGTDSHVARDCRCDCGQVALPTKLELLSTPELRVSIRHAALEHIRQLPLLNLTLHHLIQKLRIACPESIQTHKRFRTLGNLLLPRRKENSVFVLGKVGLGDARYLHGLHNLGTKDGLHFRVVSQGVRSRPRRRGSGIQGLGSRCRHVLLLSRNILFRFQ